DNCIGLWLNYGIPGAIEFVFAHGNDTRVIGIVFIRRNLPFQCALISPLEVSETFRTCLANTRVLILLLDDVCLAFRSDARQLKFLAENLSEFIEGQFNL